MGAEIQKDSNELIIKGKVGVPAKQLDCGESGLSIRMFSAIAATIPTKVTLTARGSLSNRPMNMVERSLHAAGVGCELKNGFLPVTVKGPLPGGVADIDGSISSQVLTGLLIAAPKAVKPITYRVKNLKSKPYIDITTGIMKSFGVDVKNSNYEEFNVFAPQSYSAQKYVVEGDWSGAAFFLVAGAIAGQVTVKNINIDSNQADKAVIQPLIDCGADVIQKKDEVIVKKNRLKAFDFDATHCPDLFPPLVALAAACEGETIITGVSRLRVKESDRAMTLKQEYYKLGIEIILDGDKMKIKGGYPVGSKIHSHYDHRIAMAGAVTGLLTKEPVIIEEAQAVKKSYPGFFEDLKNVGGFVL